MMETKILFIGVGSIAKRHIRNLNYLKKEKNYNIKIDVKRSDNRHPLDAEIKSIINDEYYSYDCVPIDYDIAFVTNPTSMHYDTMKKYMKNARNMFIEKPAFDNVDYDVSNLGLNKSGIYYVACPLRYTAVLQYIKHNIDCKKVIAVRSISSSYLPEWRPGQDYRTTYSAHKEMGGGVSTDLIHEWDYLTWLFGMPTDVKSIIGKYSSLDIDTDDSAIYIASNNSMTYEVHLDYYGRQNIRKLEMFFPDKTIVADLLENKIEFLGENNVIEFEEMRDTFQTREIEHYFDILNGKESNDNSIEHSLEILKISKGKY